MATNFPTNLDSYTGRSNGETIDATHVNNLQDAIVAIETKLGKDSSATNTTIDYKVNNFFVANTRKVLLYEDTAPTGWVIETTLDDKVVMVTKGSAESGQTGGGVHSTGSWTVSGITVDAHVHAGATHNHTLSASASAAGSGGERICIDSGYLKVSTANTDLWSLTGGISNNSAANTGAASSSSTTSAGTWRPAAYCCIIAKYTGA